jgi:hypothetical protein
MRPLVFTAMVTTRFVACNSSRWREWVVVVVCERTDDAMLNYKDMKVERSERCVVCVRNRRM